MTGVEIGPETPDDVEGIRRVVTAAFDADDEAVLVDALRESPAFVPALSIVARIDGSVVGHVLSTEVGTEGSASALTLAPVAVAPEYQGRGIGSRLVRAGLDSARDLGYDLVFLHGSPRFYERFGFRPAVPAGFENPFDLPDPDFQVCELAPGVLDDPGSGGAEDCGGALKYPAAFERL